MTGSGGQAYQAAREAFERDGVAVVRGFFDTEELATLEAQLVRFVSTVAPNLRDGSVVNPGDRPLTDFRVVENFAVDPFFEEFGRSPKWMALAESLLGQPVCPAVRDEYSEFGWQALFALAPGTGDRTPPHQDNFYYKFVPDETLSIWLAVDPVDEENGGMRYVRGSHKDGLRQHGSGTKPGFSQVIEDFGAADEAHEITFRLAPGDVAVHHGLTIHRAHPNRSSRRRWGFSMFFRSQRCRRDEQAHQQYLADLAVHNKEFGLV